MLSTIRSASAATRTARGPNAATVIVGGGDGGCDRRKPLTRSPASSARTSPSARSSAVRGTSPRTPVPSGDRVARRPERDVHGPACAGDRLECDRDLHRRADRDGERAEHQLDPVGATGDDARHRRRVGLRHLGHPQLVIAQPVGGERQLEVTLQRTIEPLPQHDRQPHDVTLRRGGRSTVTGVDAIETIMTTRAMRRFSGAAVDDADIERCLRAAQQAPSGGNVQPQQYLVAHRPRSSGDRGRLVPAGVRSLRAHAAGPDRVP